MRKTLILGILTACVLLVSCKEDVENVVDFSDLTEESKSLKITTNKVNSVFDDFKVNISKPLGQEIKDETSGDIIRISIDSISLRSNIDGSEFIQGGSYELLAGDSTLIYKPGEVLLLDRTYVLRIYFNYEIKNGSSWEELTNLGHEYSRSLWINYTPTVVVGKDVEYKTTAFGESLDINVYDGDIIVDVAAPAMFDINNAPANTDVALLFKSIDVKNNRLSDPTGWLLSTDSTTNTFNFNPVLNEDANHMFPSLFYTVDLQYYYMAKVGNKWDYVLDENGDTIIWDKNQSYQTTELFVPDQIIETVVGIEIPDDVRNKVFNADVRIDSIPHAAMNVVNRMEYDFNGTKFIPILDELKLLKDGSEIDVDFSWNGGDSSIAKIEPVGQYMVPGAKYVVNAIAHWQFKKDTSWLDIFDADTLKRENIGVNVFADIPNVPGIVKSLSIEDEAEEVNMKPQLSMTLNDKLQNAIELNGLKLRNDLKAFSLTSASGEVYDSVKINTDSLSFSLYLDSMLLPGVIYNLKSVTEWSYLDKDNTWKIVTIDGDDASQEDEASFTTMSVPNTIVNSYPRGSKIDLNEELYVQLNFMREEIIVKDGIEFKPIIDDIYINDDTSSIDFNGVWMTEGAVEKYRMSLAKWMTPGARYFVTALAHWEYKDLDGKFKPIYEADSFRVEGTAAKGFRALGFSDDPIILTYSPATDTLVVDSIQPKVVLTYKKDEEVLHSNTTAKVVVEKLSLYEITETDPVEVSFSDPWAAGSDSLALIVPDANLKPLTQYLLSAKVHWEFKNEQGNYVPVETTREELNHYFWIKPEE